MTDLVIQTILLSFILLGIHSYFGLEIVRRGIVFADIAVAQFSAAGLALSLLLSGEPSYLISVVFALLAGFLVALSKRVGEYSEAFIGLLYAFGFSAIVLLLSRSPHGMEDYLRLTASDILFVSRREIVETGILYASLGFLLYLRRHIKGDFFRELLFFTLFALTVASSVKLVGVLVVFSILVAPALVSVMLGKGLIFAWVYGAAVNTAGILLSFRLDLPTGFSLVFFHALLGVALTVYVATFRRRKGY